MLQIGISIASLFPGINIFHGKLHYFLRDYIDFIEILPTRGISAKTIFDIHVRGISEAWNPGTLQEVISGKIKKNSLAPKFQDWIMFPSKEECQKRFTQLRKKYKTYITVHTIKEWKKYNNLGIKVYLEVNPGLDMTVIEILDWVKNKGKILALDLYHLRRNLRKDEITKLNITDPTSKLSHPRSTLVKLLPYAGIIHLSTDRETDELEKFLLPKEYPEFYNLLKLIADKVEKGEYKGDFLIEIVPANKIELLIFPLWLGKIKKFVKKIKSILKLPR